VRHPCCKSQPRAPRPRRGQQVKSPVEIHYSAFWVHCVPLHQPRFCPNSSFGPPSRRLLPSSSSTNLPTFPLSDPFPRSSTEALAATGPDTQQSRHDSDDSTCIRHKLSDRICSTAQATPTCDRGPSWAYIPPKRPPLQSLGTQRRHGTSHLLLAAAARFCFSAVALGACRAQFDVSTLPYSLTNRYRFDLTPALRKVVPTTSAHHGSQRFR
jgi:hypothetical protein